MILLTALIGLVERVPRKENDACDIDCSHGRLVEIVPVCCFRLVAPENLARLE